VSDDIFLGRDWHLGQLQRMLAGFLDRDNPPERPQVVLISGQGGIGKSTLLREFQLRANREHGDAFQTLFVDWQSEKQTNPALSVAPDQMDSNVLFPVLERAASSSLERWEKHEKPYQQVRTDLHAAMDAASKVLVERMQGEGLRSSAGSGRADLVAEVAAAGITFPLGSFGGMAQPLVTSGLRQALQMSPRLAEFLGGKLKKPQWGLLLAPETALATGLAKSLASASEDRPVLVLLDTYELIDALDGYVRTILQEAGPRVAWVIAGRHNLYDTRNDPKRGRLNGYREEDRFRYDAIVLDLKALAREDIRELFRRRAP